mmetsp:Transcript_51496/g.168379  ORF Transcript_51496/g.168379 Transcript_51496/m.168379 type:complete len:109 (+) Transcript_51496:1270-1596(+)
MGRRRSRPKMHAVAYSRVSCVARLQCLSSSCRRPLEPRLLQLLGMLCFLYPVNPVDGAGADKSSVFISPACASCSTGSRHVGSSQVAVRRLSIAQHSSSLGLTSQLII